MLTISMLQMPVLISSNLLLGITTFDEAINVIAFFWSAIVFTALLDFVWLFYLICLSEVRIIQNQLSPSVPLYL